MRNEKSWWKIWWFQKNDLSLQTKSEMIKSSLKKKNRNLVKKVRMLHLDTVNKRPKKMKQYIEYI